MRKLLWAVAVLALAVVSLAFPGTALAGDVFHVRQKGAEALFSSTDDSGCVVTEAFVFAGNIRSQSPPGPGDRTSEAFVGLSQFDLCTGEQLLSAFGFATLGAGDFQVGGDLTSASLDTTIEVFDFVSGTSFLVDISLDWTGTGGLSRQHSNFHFHTPDFKINERFNGTFRAAEATGSISGAGMEFASGPSAFADIFSAKSGTVVID